MEDEANGGSQQPVPSVTEASDTAPEIGECKSVPDEEEQVQIVLDVAPECIDGNQMPKTECDKEELVLDVLNVDLILSVREKINSASKELFEPCVTAVKAFLAGEPFREFENSMYFHR